MNDVSYGSSMPDEASGLIDTFNFDLPTEDGSTLYNYPQIRDMTRDAIELASSGETLPRAIRKTAFRYAAEAEMLNQHAEGEEFDMSDREVCRHLEDITSFFSQLIGYELLHAERDRYRALSRARDARLRVRDFIRDERNREPLFDDISRAMKSRYQTLPYDEAARVAHAIAAFQGGDWSDDEASVMADYYDRVRRELTTSELMDSPSVPAVERAGTAETMTDWSALGKLSPREQSCFIARMLR